MFKEIIRLWGSDNLMKQVRKEMYEMLDLAEKEYNGAMKVAFHKKTFPEDITKIDKVLNGLEKSARRKVLEHLTINPQQDVTAGLTITSIVIDLERIGDYAKNILALKNISVNSSKSKRELNKYLTQLTKWDEDTKSFFNFTRQSLKLGDLKNAKKVMSTFDKNAKKMNDFLINVAKDESLDVKQAVMYVLLSRYLKRIQAHMFNIASTVVNPYDKIGFKPNGKDSEE